MANLYSKFLKSKKFLKNHDFFCLLDEFADSWKNITKPKSFFYVFTLFEWNILSSKNYNTSLELVNKDSSFKRKNEFAAIMRKKFLFLFVMCFCRQLLLFVKTYYALNWNMVLVVVTPNKFGALRRIKKNLPKEIFWVNVLKNLWEILDFGYLEKIIA